MPSPHQERGTSSLFPAEREMDTPDQSGVAVVATALIGFALLAGLALRALPVAAPPAQAPVPRALTAPAITGHAAPAAAALQKCRPSLRCRTGLFLISTLSTEEGLT